MPQPTIDFQAKILHFATRRTIPSPTVGIPQRKSCETATKFRRFWVKEPPSFRKKIYSRKKVYLNTSMVADFFSRSDVYFSPMCVRCLATHGFVYWGLACVFSYVGCVTSCGISGVRSPQKPITTTTPYNAAWACSRLRVLRRRKPGSSALRYCATPGGNLYRSIFRYILVGRFHPRGLRFLIGRVLCSVDWVQS